MKKQKANALATESYECVRVLSSFKIVDIAIKIRAAYLGVLLGILCAPPMASADRIGPLAGEIVFTIFDGHQSNLYRMAADGTMPVLVFKGSNHVNGSSLAPHWNRDRQRIVFTAMQDGNWRLFSCNRDGGDVRPEPGPSLFDDPPSSKLNYDGGLSVVAGDLYYAPNVGKKIKLYDYRAAGRKPRPEDDDGGAKDASWSPDHKWVIFSACGEKKFYDDAEPCHLYIVTPDGKTRKHLGPGEAPDWASSNP
jgi:hypothetical protein